MMMRTKTTTGTPKATLAVIGPVDDDLLKAVYRYYYLTIDQITRLFYSKGARSHAAGRLKRLADADYLHRIVTPSRQGNGPLVYTLARKGMRYLAAGGFAVPERARPAEVKEHSYLFLTHTLAVNDVLIAAELLARSHPENITLRQVLHERDLKRAPVYLTDADGAKVAVIPDAFLDIGLGGAYRVCLAVELDRGTEEQKAWRKKVRTLVAYAHGPYQQVFGTDALTVCVIATPGQARLQQLYDWTIAELAAINQQGEADLFRFATCNPAQLTPEQLFLGAGWYTPLSTTPVALIERSYLDQPSRQTNGVARAPRSVH